MSSVPHLQELLELVAQRGWREHGENLLEVVVAFLATRLGFDYAFVGELVGNTVHTKVLWGNGAIGENIEYDLAGTPCEEVMGQKLCCHQSGVQSLFPEDRLLVEMGAESYVGMPLWSSDGAPLGLLAALGGPLDQRRREETETLMQVAAVPCSQALEQHLSSQKLAQSEIALAEELAFVQLEAQISTELLEAAPDQIDDVVERALRAIMEKFGGTHCVVSIRGSRGASKTIRVDSRQDGRPEPPPEIHPIDFEWLGSLVTDGKATQLADLAAKLPEDAREERLYLAGLRISSATLVPYLASKDQPALLLLADEGDRPLDGSRLRHLKVLGELVTGALLRLDSAETRLQLERELYQSQKLEALGTLAGGIAHDFNNILAGMQGFVELALRDTAEGTQIRADLQQVLEAGRRAKELVMQILLFARQRPPADMSVSCRARKPISEAVKLLVQALPANIKVTARYATDRDYVRVDETQLYQVIVNLVTNSSHAIGDRPGSIEISVSERHSHGNHHPGQQAQSSTPHLAISVRDSGAGMDEQTRERIFEPFFTTKEVGKGSGMGMSVVHGIVSGAQGRIEVSSEPGRGTEVTVLFPLAEPANAEIPIDLSSSPPGHERILLVDDEPALLESTTRLLEAAGYSVEAFASPTDALRRFIESPDAFDILITDATMPNMSGNELIHALRLQRNTLPCILCTGHSAESKVVDTVLARPDLVMNKPFRIATLVARLRDLMSA